MNSNERGSSISTLDEDIDKLSKTLYLTDSEVWMDFKDKISDKIFDEMVLFFATKYNHLSIIMHVVDNNIINLNAPSKNENYPNIIQHLIYIAILNNNKEICNYLENLSSNDGYLTSKDNSVKVITENFKGLTSNILHDKAIIDTNINGPNNYIPEYICTNCNSNIFSLGYKVCEDIIYNFSKSENKLVEVSRTQLNDVTCCNCNNTIENISFKELEHLSIIQNCGTCGSNLMNCGILDKSNLKFNEKSNKFISTNITHHCSNCDSLINKSQEDFFGF